jgi:acyl-CoA reductase-like NAD-dependent aldehyde dehydrogenase
VSARATEPGTVTVEGVEVPTGHIIGGERRASADGATFEVRSPIDWSWKLADLPAGGAAEVDAAVAAACAAFPAWAALGPEGRAPILRRLADLVEQRATELARVETVDNGSLLEAMRDRVMPRGGRNFRFFADYAVERLAEPSRTLPGGERNGVRHDPAGVVAVSTPWNAPFMLATWRIGPALAAGNTVVFKTPEWAPLTGSLLGTLAEEAGVPAGVLNVVHGERDAGAALTGHPDVDRVAFTGSPATARRVMQDAGAQLTPVSFELGGKSPFVVFADADLDAAARTAAYQYDNSGQVCLAGTRLLVERACLDEFRERLHAEVGRIRVGDPRDPATTYGPLIHPVALDRVIGHVGRAVEHGATLAFGGEPIEGLYFPPTLFTDVPPDADILRREVFGPVLTLQAFHDEAEAAALANATDYGLAATIYTGDEGRAARVARAVTAGTIWVNCFYVRDLETPFGGAKDSGIGREGGRHSFDFYCDVKTVCERTELYAG